MCTLQSVYQTDDNTMEMTAKALRSQVAAAFACLDRGETVTITYRGKPRAKLVSVDEPVRDDEDRMPAFGMWQDRQDMANVEAHVRELRKGRQLAG